MGKVARCFEFCAFEYFESIDEAVQFRKNVICSIILFLMIVIMKTCTLYMLYEFRIITVNSINLTYLLETIEFLFTLYMLYSMHIFTLCL